MFYKYSVEKSSNAASYLIFRTTFKKSLSAIKSKAKRKGKHDSLNGLD